MRGDMVSELRLAALYANQVARAIVRMDYRLSNFFFYAMRSTHNTFAIDVLGTPAIATSNISFESTRSKQQYGTKIMAIRNVIKPVDCSYRSKILYIRFDRRTSKKKFFKFF